MPLTVHRFVSGPVETNAWLIVDPETGDAIVIDAPPAVTPHIHSAVKELGIQVHTLVLTHGHYDHIVDTVPLADALQAQVVGHPELQERLNGPQAGPFPISPRQLDATISEGDTVTVGNAAFTVFHMPGHDVAHITLYNDAERIMIGGDVLFPGGHGRTDLPGSDQATMNATLKRFLDLPADVIVYPGHGNEVRVGDEHQWIRGLV